MKYVAQSKTGKVAIAPNIYGDSEEVLCSNPPKYKVILGNGEIDYWVCDSVYKKVDTIIELINRIVIRKGKYSYRILTKYQFAQLSARKLLADIKSGRSVVFGAVWTDAGLKYIARFDEKGEWKLL